MSKETEFSSLHAGGIRGLLLTYGGLEGILSSTLLWISLVFSLLSIIGIYLLELSNKKLTEIIRIVCDIGLSIEGSLIGLSLAGLTLVVTFGSDLFMKKLIQIAIKQSLSDKVFVKSLYQRAIAIFAYAVLIQVSVLVCLFIIRTALQLEITISSEIAFSVNLLAVYFLVAAMLYSFLLVGQMTVNLFTLGQSNHAIYYEEAAAADGNGDQTAL